MTHPVAEPSDYRTLSGLQYRTRQLARRPPLTPPAGTAVHEIKVFEDWVPVVVGDDRFVWEVPEDLDGATLVKVAGFISTAGSEATEVAIRLSDPCDDGPDILVEKIIIEAGECGSKTAATQPEVVEDTIVSWGQHLHIDVDAAGTGAMGLGVHIIYAPSTLASVVLEGAQGPPGGATNFTGAYPGGPGAAGTPGGAGSAWTTATGYDVGDVVENDGTYYIVTVSHTSDASNEPGVGVDWEDFWDELVYTEGDVVTNGGTTYVAIVTHTATTLSEPGVGADWEDFWMILIPGEGVASVQAVIRAGTYPIDPGIKAHLPIPYDCTIVEATLLADQAGSVVVDLWTDGYGNYPPTDADSITGATPLTLSAQNKTTNTALTDWDTTLNEGDVLTVNIDSISGINLLTVALKLERAAPVGGGGGGGGGVETIAAEGETPLDGDVTFSAGANITLTQVGQDIEIASTGGAGGGEDPIFEVFGDPDTTFEFDTSSLTGLTALSTTPDAEDADTTVPGHYYVADDNNTGSNKVMGRYASVSTPFTAVTRLHNSMGGATNIVTGLFIGEATPGVMEVVGHANSPTGGQGTRYLLVIRYTNPTTYSSSPATYVVGPLGTMFYAIRANSSTSVDYFYSFDGYIWVPLALARNPSITVGSVGVAMDLASSGALRRSIAADYLRIWNSALVLPGVA